MNRYDRQIRLPQVGKQGQERLRQSTVLIVGCGATGTYTAEQLVRAGLGRIILVDDDVIELSNLQRQALFSEADLGQKKVEVAGQKLKQINSELEITLYSKNFRELIFDETARPDLLLDCTDNFLARELINNYCRQLRIPFILATAAGTTGQVMAIQPEIGPCLNCVYPDLTELEKNCETIGVVTPLIPMISSLQVSLALKVLINPDFKDWSTLLVLDIWSAEIHKFEIPKHCHFCKNGKTVKKQLEKVCGGVYQVILADFQIDEFEKFCLKKNWSLQKNKLASRTTDITAFSNGRILFYSDKAEKQFQELENFLNENFNSDHF